MAWSCYEQLRAIYAGTDTTKAPRLAEKVISSFPSCPIPEVARLGRTLRAWRAQILAYFDTSGLSNGDTEAINMLIKKARRRSIAACHPRGVLVTGRQQLFWSQRVIGATRA